jgi:hypothetical protein
MSTSHSTRDQNQSTISTKKSILIRPENDLDLNDFIYINNYKAGRRFRDALERLSVKYNFSYNDYKRNRIKITLDFAGIQQQQQQAQEKKNSEGI